MLLVAFHVQHLAGVLEEIRCHLTTFIVCAVCGLNPNAQLVVSRRQAQVGCIRTLHSVKHHKLLGRLPVQVVSKDEMIVAPDRHCSGFQVMLKPKKQERYILRSLRLLGTRSYRFLIDRSSLDNRWRARAGDRRSDDLR